MAGCDGFNQRIRAGVLNVGYAEAGPPNGPVAILLHGWRLGYEKNRRELTKLIWKQASPKWEFDDATFERTASAFDNADHVPVVIHNYRWRLSLAAGEPRYDDLEKKLSRAPVITVPTVTLASDFDGAAADGVAYAKQFTGKHTHRVLPGIGHNVPQEAPQAFASAIVEVDRG